MAQDDNTRERGKISSAQFGKDADRGFNYFTIMIEFDGSAQGFQCCVGDELDYCKRRILALFCVNSPDELKGKECFVLRCFNGWNHPIEGLETMEGRRLTRHDLFPKLESPLEQRRSLLKNSIANSRTDIARCESQLSALDSRYTDWSSK